MGISEPLQREFLPTFGTQYHEDGFASTTFGGCFGDVGYVMGPIETQGEVFSLIVFAGFGCLDFYIRWIQHVLVFFANFLVVMWLCLLLCNYKMLLKHKVGCFFSFFAGFNCLDFYIPWI